MGHARKRHSGGIDQRGAVVVEVVAAGEEVDSPRRSQYAYSLPYKPVISTVAAPAATAREDAYRRRATLRATSGLAPTYGHTALWRRRSRCLGTGCGDYGLVDLENRGRRTNVPEEETIELAKDGRGPRRIGSAGLGFRGWQTVETSR